MYVLITERESETRRGTRRRANDRTREREAPERSASTDEEMLSGDESAEAIAERIRGQARGTLRVFFLFCYFHIKY